jgi:hypothetical protein
MKVFTIKSVDVLDEPLQMEIHYAFGMEHYTDYVFKPRGGQKYSATIVLEDTSAVVRNVLKGSCSFPDREFLLDDLDMEANNVDRLRIKDGKIVKRLTRGWDWEEII